MEKWSDKRKVVEIGKEGRRAAPTHPPGLQMVFPYISLVNQLKMENLTRGRRAAPPFQFLPPLQAAFKFEWSERVYFLGSEFLFLGYKFFLGLEF